MVAIPSFRAQHMYMPWLSSSPPRSRRTNYPPARWYSFPKVNHVATSAGASPIYSRSTRGSHTRSTASAVLRMSGPTSSSNSLTPVPVMTPSPARFSNLVWRKPTSSAVAAFAASWTTLYGSSRGLPSQTSGRTKSRGPRWRRCTKLRRLVAEYTRDEMYIIGSSFPVKWSKCVRDPLHRPRQWKHKKNIEGPCRMQGGVATLSHTGSSRALNSLLY